MAKTQVSNLPNFDIRPKSISQDGVVTFTDGTNDVVPNQVQCEAYGYTYDVLTGTCRIFRFKGNIQGNITRETNRIEGNNNILGSQTDSSFISGQDNRINGYSRNNIITGTQNQISSNINNATVLGINGRASRQSEFALGGGLNSINSGAAFADRQMSVIQLSGYTTDNTATSLTVNNQGGNFINVRNNSIIGWEVFLTRLEVGGSSGTAGKFSYRLFQGCTVVDNSYSMTFTTGFTRNIAKDGVNGTFAMIDSGSNTMTVQCTDRNNVNNIWNAIVYLHELTSTNITF